jgi:hypothetical protein
MQNVRGVRTSPNPRMDFMGFDVARWLQEQLDGGAQRWR